MKKGINKTRNPSSQKITYFLSNFIGQLYVSFSDTVINQNNFKSKYPLHVSA